MKVVLLFCFLAFQLASAEEVDIDIDPNDNLTEEEFEEYFHVDPADDPEEEERRAEALAENEEYIKEINQEYVDEEIDWFDKINEFSNLPEDEAENEKTGLLEEDEDRFAEYGRGLFLDDYMEPDARSEQYFNKFRFSRAEVPESYSSVDLGYVSPVKHQGSCGSCAAFATTAMIETCFKKITGVFGDYSEQHLVDCAYHEDPQRAFGCDGAYSSAYATWANSTDGLLSEEDYPYQNNNPSLVCPTNIEHYNQGARVSNFYYTWQSDEELLKKMVYEHGAVYTSVGVYNPFFSYGGGVFSGCEPDQNTNHAVVVVGYGTTEKGKKYWTIKNSWGTSKLVVVMCERDSSVPLPEEPSTTAMPNTTTPATPDCFDKNMWCAKYKKKGLCDPSHKKYKWAKKNCKNTCEICQREEACVDNYGKCPKYVDIGYCEKKKFFRSSCKKSCGDC